MTESFLFPVRGPKELSELWPNQFCFLSCWLSLCSCRLPCGEWGYCMKMNESFLFPLLLTELMQLPPAMWRGRVVHENERIIFVSCPADWAYAAAAGHVVREGTAWKWTHYSLRRLVTPESYKGLVHNERNDTSLTYSLCLPLSRASLSCPFVLLTSLIAIVKSSLVIVLSVPNHV